MLGLLRSDYMVDQKVSYPINTALKKGFLCANDLSRADLKQRTPPQLHTHTHTHMHSQSGDLLQIEINTISGH